MSEVCKVVYESKPSQLYHYDDIFQDISQMLELHLSDLLPRGSLMFIVTPKVEEHKFTKKPLASATLLIGSGKMGSINTYDSYSLACVFHNDGVTLLALYGRDSSSQKGDMIIAKGEEEKVKKIEEGLVAKLKELEVSPEEFLAARKKYSS